MAFLGKNLNMSIVASIDYGIEVVGKEGQSDLIIASNDCSQYYCWLMTGQCCELEKI